MAQGEKPLNGRLDYNNGVGFNTATGEFAFTYNGDLTGKYISGTYTRLYVLGKGVTALYYENWQATSEMSNPMRVTP